MESTRILVVGAGISGLSFTYFLQKQLKTKPILRNQQITVVDSASEPSGWIRTKHTHNNIYLEQGPRAFSIRGKEDGPGAYVVSLLHDLKQENSLQIPKNTSKYIYKNGKLEKIPESLFEAFKSPLMKGVWGELFHEMYYKTKSNDIGETIEEWALRKFGSKHILENFIDPMVAGIYAGCVDKLSFQRCFPSIDIIEKKYSSILRGMLASKSDTLQYSILKPTQVPLFQLLKTHGLVSIKNGMQSFIQTLYNELQKSNTSSIQINIAMERQVENITPNLQNDNKSIKVKWKNQNTIDENLFDYVYVTVPAKSFAPLIPSSIIKYNLQKVITTSIWVVNVIYKLPSLSDSIKSKYPGFGVLFPTNSILPPNQQAYNSFNTKEYISHPLYGLLGITFDSDTFPALYTDTYGTLHHGMTLMFGGERYPEIAEICDISHIQKMTINCLQYLFNITPTDLHINLCRDCIVQFYPQHDSIIQNVRNQISQIFLSKNSSITPLQFFGNCYNSPALGDSISVAYNFASQLSSIIDTY